LLLNQVKIKLNLVDILDEMAIVGVPSNAIVNDFSEELKLLEGK
jgi:hypothetical protein